MARMRPVLFSSTSAAPCTVGRTRNCACAAAAPVVVPFCLGAGLAPQRLALHHVDIDDIVEGEAAPDRAAIGRQGAGCGRRRARREWRHRRACRRYPKRPPAANARRRAAGGRSAAPVATPARVGDAAAAGARRARRSSTGRAGRREFLDGVGEIGLGAVKFRPAARYLVARRALPAAPASVSRCNVALMVGVHRVGRGGQARHAVGLGFAADEIDEMEAGVAMRPLKGDKLRRRAERLVFLRGADDAVFLHAAEHVAEPLLGAVGMAVRIEISSGP